MTWRIAIIMSRKKTMQIIRHSRNPATMTSLTTIKTSLRAILREFNLKLNWRVSSTLEGKS